VWVRKKEHKIVGMALAAARRRKGLTQIELAKRLRKPQSFVSNYEVGQRRIDIIELLRIADALEMDPRLVLTAIRRDQRGASPRRR
jgi:transcriptional regulator with XRE-family HTH domain